MNVRNAMLGYVQLHVLDIISKRDFFKDFELCCHFYYYLRNIMIFWG